MLYYSWVVILTMLLLIVARFWHNNNYACACTEYGVPLDFPLHVWVEFPNQSLLTLWLLCALLSYPNSIRYPLIVVTLTVVLYDSLFVFRFSFYSCTIHACFTSENSAWSYRDYIPHGQWSDSSYKVHVYEWYGIQCHVQFEPIRSCGMHLKQSYR